MFINCHEPSIYSSYESWLQISNVSLMGSCLLSLWFFLHFHLQNAMHLRTPMSHFCWREDGDLFCFIIAEYFHFLISKHQLKWEINWFFTYITYFFNHLPLIFVYLQTLSCKFMMNKHKRCCHKLLYDKILPFGWLTGWTYHISFCP